MALVSIADPVGAEPQRPATRLPDANYLNGEILILASRHSRHDIDGVPVLPPGFDVPLHAPSASPFVTPTVA